MFSYIINLNIHSYFNINNIKGIRIRQCSVNFSMPDKNCINLVLNNLKVTSARILLPEMTTSILWEMFLSRKEKCLSSISSFSVLIKTLYWIQILMISHSFCSYANRVPFQKLRVYANWSILISKTTVLKILCITAS